MRLMVMAALAAALFAGSLATAIPAYAQATTANPIAPPSEKIPTDVRRVTIIVTDMERSLKLYRDALGLKVNYDAPMDVSGAAFTQGGKPRPIRLVLLNGNDPWIGWIGLIQYTDEPNRPKLKLPKHLGPGSLVIVTNVDDAQRRCDAAAQIPGVRIASPVKVHTYPGRNGGPEIKVLGCQLFDPDGAFVELNSRM